MARGVRGEVVVQVLLWVRAQVYVVTLTIGRPGVWMVAAAGWCWPLPCRACGGGEEDPKSLCGLMDALAPLVLPVRWAGR